LRWACPPRLTRVPTVEEILRRLICKRPYHDVTIACMPCYVNNGKSPPIVDYFGKPMSKWMSIL